jgi:hypothetical protein
MNKQPCRRYVKGPPYWAGHCLRCGHPKDRHIGLFARLYAGLFQ